MEQHGAQVTGTYTDADGSSSSFTGTLSGTNGIRIRLDDGSIELSGTFSEQRRGDEKFPGWLFLTARGGAVDGALIEFSYYDPYS